MRNTYTVGQKLWYVPGRGQACEVVILKVGRKWVTIDTFHNYRLDIADKDMYVMAGDYIVGRCYLSQDAYTEMLGLQAAWAAFYLRINRFSQRWSPNGVTVEKIKQAQEILFGEEGAE